MAITLKKIHDFIFKDHQDGSGMLYFRILFLYQIPATFIQRPLDNFELNADEAISIVITECKYLFSDQQNIQLDTLLLKIILVFVILSILKCTIFKIFTEKKSPSNRI